MSLLLFRMASRARLRLGPRNPIAASIGIAYRVIVEWILGLEIPWQVEVGPRLRVFHGHAIVVNPAAKLGSDVTLRHGVTIGNRRAEYDCPVIGDYVELGAHSAVLGPVTVGDRAKVGAYTLVLTDVPEGATAVGNPARIILGATGG